MNDIKEEAYRDNREVHMSGSNKVNVVIFRREYTVSGSKPRDHIVRVADYVDGVMTDIAEQAGGISPSTLAVLSAVNIADDLFAVRDEVAAKESEKEQLEKDIAHYIQLWEEAKRNFLQHKEDSQAFADRMAGIQEKLNEKAIENDRLLKAAAEKDRKILELSAEKDRMVADVRDERDRRIEEIVSEKDARIEELTGESERRATAIAKEKDTRIAELSEELERRVTSVAEEKDARIVALSEELNGRVASVTAEKDARIAALSEELNKRVASVTEEKDARVDELTRERNQRIASITSEKDARIEELTEKVADLTAKLKTWEENHDVSPDQIIELNDKYRELEGNYFEIQMENIRLKGEIERLNSLASE
jgi:cell division protein ZapA (FtsZ GTPase activity inhibitor)